MDTLENCSATPPSADSGFVLDIEKIRRKREELGLTMEEAARRAGLAGRQRWYEIEAGRRTDVRLSTLEGIARALQCKSVADLLK